MMPSASQGDPAVASPDPRPGEIVQQGEADQHRTHTTSTESPREKQAYAEDHWSIEGDRLGEPRGIPPRGGEPDTRSGTGLRRATASRRRR